MAIIINNHSDNSVRIQRNKEYLPYNIHRVIINILEGLD